MGRSYVRIRVASRLACEFVFFFQIFVTITTQQHISWKTINLASDPYSEDYTSVVIVAKSETSSLEFNLSFWGSAINCTVLCVWKVKLFATKRSIRQSDFPKREAATENREFFWGSRTKVTLHPKILPAKSSLDAGIECSLMASQNWASWPCLTQPKVPRRSCLLTRVRNLMSCFARDEVNRLTFVRR